MTAMTNKGALIIYLCAEGQEWILVPSGDETQDSYTRVIHESYSWKPGSTASVGDRLTKHEIVSHDERRVIPDQWVVVEVQDFEPSEYASEFNQIVLAYCERQPLSPEEVERQSYVVEVKRPALV